MLAIAAGLPGDFGGSVFVVSHIGAHRSHLPHLMSRAGPLPARSPEDGERVRPGTIYIAPPDRHILVEAGRIRLSRGPRQHFTRPSIDPLFLSAASAFGPRVIGVVLSGTGSDGAAGLRQIQRAGGLTVVQLPAASLYPEMPRNAAAAVRADHIVCKEQVPALLLHLSSQTVDAPATAPPERASPEMEMERPVTLTCPECGGAVRRVCDGLSAEFRCHTGHHFGLDDMVAGQGQKLEEALVVAVRVLNERIELCRNMKENARAGGRDLGVAHWERLQREADDQFQVLRRFLEHQPPPPPEEPDGNIGAKHSGRAGKQGTGAEPAGSDGSEES